MISYTGGGAPGPAMRRKKPSHSVADQAASSASSLPLSSPSVEKPVQPCWPLQEAARDATSPLGRLYSETAPVCRGLPLTPERNS